MNLKFWTKEFWNTSAEAAVPNIKADSSRGYAGLYYYDSYDGEKNFGEVGPVKDLRPNYQILSLRSWQAYLESDMAQTIVKKYCAWIMDKGLKAQAQPNAEVLGYSGLSVDQTLNKQIEARFNLWARSKKSSYNGMTSVNKLAKTAFKNAKIGGDVLVVLRLKDGHVTVQLIDGAHVQTPPSIATTLDGKVIDGVEVDNFGKHVAYHVRSGKTIENSFTRIPAFSAATGLQTAFLVYGSEYRMNTRRGLPVIATVLESIAKLDRYKEAAVGSAEERAKIVYQIVHQQFSDGENPLAKELVAAFDVNHTAYNNGELPVTADGQQVANDFYASTNKQAWNMPLGAEMKAINSQNELFFKEFYQTNADIICGAVGIPPNVAFSVYNDSFSASRAATKDWDHTIEVERDDFREQFYQRIYDFWLHAEILLGRINAPGYLAAYQKKDELILEAYRQVRFTGPLFPHIDPLKEAKAEREKLGPNMAGAPLTTLENATEALNGGDADDNLKQFAEEVKRAEDLGIETAPKKASEMPSDDGDGAAEEEE